MTFARAEMLYLIWVAPLLLAFYVYGHRRRREILGRFSSSRTLAAISPEASPTRDWIKAGLTILSLALVALALAGVQYGYTWRQVERKGVSLMIALDCSRSMLANDVKPSRLERAKREILDLLDRMEGDKVGLTAFAGTAFLQCPLTSDYSAFHLFLNVLSPDFLPVGGTDLAAAIETGVKGLDSKDGSEKAIILITDGESTTEDALDAAREAAEQNIRIFTIGVGTPDGSPIPDRQGGLKKDVNGNIILSRLDEDALKRIASLTGGAYVRSVSGDMDLDAIYSREIKGKMERATLEGGRKKIFMDRFQIIVGLALAALLLSMILPSTRKAALVIALFFIAASAQPGLADSERGLTASGLDSYRQGDYQKALENFQKAKVLRPDDPLTSFNLGNAHYKLKNFQEAQKCYREAARAEEKNLKQMALYNLGNSSYRLGQLPQAVKQYREALKINPRDHDARRNLDFVNKQLEQQQQDNQKQSGSDQREQKDNKQEEKGNKAEKKSQEKKGDRQNPPEKQKQDQASRPDKPREQEAKTEQQQASTGQDQPKEQDDKPEQKKASSGQDEPEQNEKQDRRESRPEYGSAMDSSQARDQKPDQDRDEKTAGAGKRKNGNDRPQDLSQAQRMLNRLNDKPGRALMPVYRERQVERDW